MLSPLVSIPCRCFVVLLSILGSVYAQEAEPKESSKQALEAKFIKTMTNAILEGRWCIIDEGKLSPAREEKYTINGVSKIGDDGWLISARIQYGDRDMTIPVPVQLKWAGDTPVITVSNLGLPGFGPYSARVLVFNDTYAGTWSGPNVVGLLNGLIRHDSE